MIKDIRRAMAAQMESVARLRPFGYAKDSVPVPAATIGLSSVDYEQTFRSPSGRAAHAFDFTVRIYASRASDRGGQDTLDDFLDPSGPTSVYAALDADRTLGGLVETLQIGNPENYGVYEVAGIPYFGVEITVTVLARGT